MLTTPLSVAAFIDSSLFSGASMTFMLPDNRRFNRTAGGLVLGSERGARLWQGSITLTPRLNADAAAIDALLMFLTSGENSFFLYDCRSPFPKMDPAGTLVAASSPILAAVAANRQDINISGLPVGYVLSPGDTLSFAYGSSPTRYALHKVVVGATASAFGVISNLQVTPQLRPGYTAGVTAIVLRKPVMKAQIMPGTYRPSTYQAGRLSAPAAFDFTQTLR